MNLTARTLALAATLVGALNTTAAAQLDATRLDTRSKTGGFSLGVFANGSAIRVEDSDVVESGAGGSLHLGYGFNPNVSIFMRANAAVIQPSGSASEYALAHFDLGARYSFGGSGSAVRPFLQGAAGGRGVAADMGSEGILEARGAGFTGGAGLEYFFNPNLALEAGLSMSFGQFTEGRVDDSEWVEFGDDAFSATSSRFDIGVTWHP